MIKIIENQYLKVEVNLLGAEVFSIKSKKTGIEYLWQGNDNYWGDKSPVLFPICGRLFGGKYTFNGNDYLMPIHGFARLSMFSLKSITNSKIELELKSNEETKKVYPFDFSFTVSYSLVENALKTKFIVKNTGDGKLYFAYGAHPGFNVPFTNNDSFEDYYIDFNQDAINQLIFSDTCFNTDKIEKYALTDGKLPLKHSLFDNDALFFESKNNTVRLKSIKNKNSVEISYKDMTCLGLWHKPKSDAPYVCIEPWHGIPSTDGIIDELTSKKQMLTLNANNEYSNSYDIKIIEE